MTAHERVSLVISDMSGPSSSAVRTGSAPDALVGRRAAEGQRSGRADARQRGVASSVLPHAQGSARRCVVVVAFRMRTWLP